MPIKIRFRFAFLDRFKISSGSSKKKRQNKLCTHVKARDCVDNGGAVATGSQLNPSDIIGNYLDNMGTQLPSSLMSLFAIILCSGHKYQGIFRKSVLSSHVMGTLEKLVNWSTPLDITSHSPLIVAATIKKILSLFPNGVLSSYLKVEWEKAAYGQSIQIQLQKIINLYTQLPTGNQKFLNYLLVMCTILSDSVEFTKMTVKNFGIVLAPPLFHGIHIFDNADHIEKWINLSELMIKEWRVIIGFERFKETVSEIVQYAQSVYLPDEIQDIPKEYLPEPINQPVTMTIQSSNSSIDSGLDKSVSEVPVDKQYKSNTNQTERYPKILASYASRKHSNPTQTQQKSKVYANVHFHNNSNSDAASTCNNTFVEADLDDHSTHGKSIIPNTVPSLSLKDTHSTYRCRKQPYQHSSRASTSKSKFYPPDFPLVTLNRVAKLSRSFQEVPPRSNTSSPPPIILQTKSKVNELCRRYESIANEQSNASAHYINRRLKHDFVRVPTTFSSITIKQNNLSSAIETLV